MRKQFKTKIKRVLAISMALSMLFCNNAFATPIDVVNSTESVVTDTLDKINGTDYFDDELTNEWLDGTISEEVRVTVEIESLFEVTIPKEIVLDGETGKADYKVKAVGDIAGDQKLSVVPDPDLVLSEAGGKADVTAIVTQPDTEYIYTDLQGDGTEYDGSIAATLTAGEWAGKFAFNISFEDVSHSHNYIPEEIAPTCTSTGYTKYTCNCGATYNEGEVAKLEHVYVPEVTKKANCTETGVRTYTCECGETYTEDIAINLDAHNYIDSICEYCGNKLLEAYSWDEIAEISETGKAQTTYGLKVGDTKEIILSNGETYNAEIIGFNHDDLADGSGKAGITFQFKECMTTTHVMNTENTNVGGWEASEMRDYVNNDVYNLLPSDLQTEIKEVSKVSDVGNKNTTDKVTITDKLFLLSLEEVGLSHSHNVAGQGEKYEKFTDKASRIKYLSGSVACWWLRSTYTYYANSFFNVDLDGGFYAYNANGARGVAPAFCI